MIWKCEGEYYWVEDGILIKMGGDYIVGKPEYIKPKRVYSSLFDPEEPDKDTGKGLSPESIEYISQHRHKLPIAGLVSMIYTRGFEYGRKTKEKTPIRYMDMYKRVEKELDRFRQQDNLKRKGS